MLKLLHLEPLPGYRLRLRYADGVTGEVDLSHLVGKGVFELWNDHEAFGRVSIGTAGEVRWSEEVDLCADALYLEITGKQPDEVFPRLRKALSMPEISRFYGIVIKMFHNDHQPPHFHAEHGGDQMIVDIETLGVIAGRLVLVPRDW